MKEGEANGAIKSYVVRCERTGQYRAVLAANPREACEILDAEDGLWDERREFVTTPAEDAHALYCVYAPHGWVASRENVDAMSRARIVQRSTYVGSFALTRASQERERDRLLALQSQAWRERHGETIPGHEGEDDWTARLAVFAGPEGFADDWGEEYLNEPFLEPFDDEMLQVQGRPLQALHAHEDSTAHPPDAPDPDPLTLLDPAALEGHEELRNGRVDADPDPGEVWLAPWETPDGLPPETEGRIEDEHAAALLGHDTSAQDAGR